MNLGFIIYAIISVIMSILWTAVCFKATSLDEFGVVSKVLFVLYFIVGNLVAWPIISLLALSYSIFDQ